MEDNIGPIDLSVKGSLAKKFKLQKEEEKNDLSFLHRVATIPSPESDCSEISDRLLYLEQRLTEQLNILQFSSPVNYIYNPLEYAFETHNQYVKKYCTTTKQVLLMGMNPGPFGMVQTGVPFGEVSIVKEWLKIEGAVGKPTREHPQRRVLGFSCTRSEVSGQRFWNFFKELCQTPNNFFRYSFVHNYCPLVFMTDSGKNITPPSLPIVERKALQKVCDQHICEVIKLLEVKMVIAVGRYTHNRVRAVLENESLTNVKAEFIMHPSPINPVANKSWNEVVMKQLHELKAFHYFCP